MTMDTVYNYTTLSKNPNDTKAIQQEVNKVGKNAKSMNEVDAHIFCMFQVIEQQLTLDELETSVNTSSASSEIDAGETDLALGKINGGRRVDYVLQEAPLEIINEYLFALTSHVCYWYELHTDKNKSVDKSYIFFFYFVISGTRKMQLCLLWRKFIRRSASMLIQKYHNQLWQLNDHHQQALSNRIPWASWIQKKNLCIL